MSTLPEIVKKLRAASDAYYNGDKPLMTDDEYDELRDELAKRSPSHPFLREVGAPVGSGAITLPYIMASLNKIKPGTGAVENFKNKSTTKHWLLSEKLDGISALWHEGRLYLRGDGQMGVEVTKFVPHIQGLRVCEFPVRGELVVARAEPCVAGTLARSWVNGQLHQKEPQPEIRVVRFVAYEIIGEGKPSEQFRGLKEAGFEVPWNIAVGEAEFTEESLASFLRLRREKSVYDTDGIVVAENVVSPIARVVKNPTSKMAFKMVIADQCAETTIVEVEWNASAQGYLIPRLQIEPVVVGSARIEFVTAHNAKFVVDNKLAPGARIVIRRSGDVIPAVDRVVTAAAAPKMPNGSEGSQWKWDANATHLVQIAGTVVSTEVLKAQLVHFAKTMEIVGMGPGVVAKLVDAGVDSVRKLFGTKSTDLVRILGKTLGPKIEAELEAISGRATEIQLMVASSRMPRLIGDTKLKVLFDLKADPRQWSTLPAPQGWSADKLADLIAVLSTYETWRQSETPHIPYPILPAAAPVAVAPSVAKGTVCFTGVRSKELESQLETAGWKVVSSVSGKLGVLIVADTDGADTSEKAKKAQDLGVRILKISSVKKELGLV
jgi:NAD-dependent DNA ligase